MSISRLLDCALRSDSCAHSILSTKNVCLICIQLRPKIVFLNLLHDYCWAHVYFMCRIYICMRYTHIFVVIVDILTCISKNEFLFDIFTWQKRQFANACNTLNRIHTLCDLFDSKTEFHVKIQRLKTQMKTTFLS